MSNISYDRGKKRVRQTLGAISTYDLEGEFGNAVNNFMAEYGHYKKYIDEATEIKETGYASQKYLDGVDKKTVKFDKLLLDYRNNYDDEKQLCVVGERDMDVSELAAMGEETKQQQEREKEQLRKLREKYPDA